jgi:hypothetical protein
MKNKIVIVCVFLSTAVVGQIENTQLEIFIIKETLPQLLNYGYRFNFSVYSL